MESDTYSPLLNISVIPQTSYRLAPAIWNKMYNYPKNYYSHSPVDRTILPLLIATLLTLASS